MLQKIQRQIKELNMISPEDVVLVGVSGGADSVCLFLLLKELAHEMGFLLEAVHVEHGIRGEESKRDAEFVESLCCKNNVLIHRIDVDVPKFCEQTGMGTEEAARHLRYKAFSDAAMGRRVKVALAHHMEDNAETILFQMLRGSSLTGLCGMQPIREAENGITYIRPLLSVHRFEVEKYLQEKGQDYCVDSTNKELDYSRNYLRHIVLPELTKINDQAIAHVNMTGNQLGDIRDYIEQETKRYWNELVKEGDELTLDVPKLQSLHIAIQKEILYKAIAVALGSKKDISSVHVDSLLELCQSQSGKERILPQGVIARREFDAIRMYKQEKQKNMQGSGQKIFVSMEQLEECRKNEDIMELVLTDAGDKIAMRVFSSSGQITEIPKKTYTKWLDYDKIKQGFCIRTRQNGDYFIGDVFGHRKKLKQYFIDEKISSAEREKMWILAQESLVLWLIGGRISEHLKVTEETNTIIEIQYNGGN